MAITRVSQSSVKEGLEKHGSFYGGLSGTLFGQYESIQTITVGAGGQGAVEFTNIPGTFQHLQVRSISRCSDTAAVDAAVILQVNGVSVERNHGLSGSGSAAGAFSGASGYSMNTLGANALANTFAASVIDILDYTSTSKNKTIRVLNGYDVNGSGGYIIIYSSLRVTTSAVTSLRLYGGWNWLQHTTFALYGIKAP